MSIEERRARREARRARRTRRQVQEEAVVKEAPIEEAVVKEAPVEEAPKQERRQRRTRKAEVEAPIEEAVVKEAPVEVNESPLSLDDTVQLTDGRIVALQELKTLLFNGAVPAPSGKKGRLPGDFWQNIQEDDYNEWIAEWQQKTYEDKVAYAEKNEVEWDKHDNERVDHMRVTLAVQAWEGIEYKYKEPYRDARAFKEAKERARAGLPY